MIKMKKHFLLLSLAFIAISVRAQISIPNGNLENWISGISNYPQYYQYNSNEQNFFRYKLPFNIEKTTDAFNGVSAVKLFTNANTRDTSGAYFVNSPATDGNNWHGGVPYTLIPTGFRGYYKYNVATADSALVLAAFSKAGTNIGTYFFKLGGIKTTYTPFNFTFNPPLSQAPDSVIFGATSSDMIINKAIPGSTLFIDSVSFTGVASQPALLNGDFESWGSVTLYSPFSWYSEERGTKRSTDFYGGNYAAELTTYLSDNKSTPIARSGQLSTGYYSNSCRCMRGGYPFSNKIDTLVFYYKYAPAVATDSAMVSITFKKNGSTYNGFSKNFPASLNYRYMQIPVDLVTAPDTVILDIRSSMWTNTAVSYVGAVLKIDEINFKSQMLPTNIRSFSNDKNINIYPNPSNGKFTIQISDGKMLLAKGKIEIYNEFGKKVLRSEIKNQKLDFDISDMPNGIYFVKIYDGAVTLTEKIIKR